MSVNGFFYILLYFSSKEIACNLFSNKDIVCKSCSSLSISFEDAIIDDGRKISYSVRY